MFPRKGRNGWGLMHGGTIAGTIGLLGFLYTTEVGDLWIKLSLLLFFGGLGVTMAGFRMWVSDPEGIRQAPRQAKPMAITTLVCLAVTTWSIITFLTTYFDGWNTELAPLAWISTHRLVVLSISGFLAIASGVGGWIALNK